MDAKCRLIHLKLLCPILSYESLKISRTDLIKTLWLGQRNERKKINQKII